jgi:hypothetical protein
MGVHDEVDGCVVHGWCGRPGPRTVADDEAERVRDEHARRMLGDLR